MANILDRTKGLLENKKKNVEWASPQLTQRLLTLKRPRLNETLQVLTGHCNLQKHRSIMEHDVSSTCPKCNLEEETPNHHDGECTYSAKNGKLFLKKLLCATYKAIMLADNNCDSYFEKTLANKY